MRASPTDARTELGSGKSKYLGVLYTLVTREYISGALMSDIALLRHTHTSFG